MKKTKLISLLLAAVMILSCFTAAFTVFAAGGNTKNAVTLINSVKGKLDADNARPQAVAKYQAAVDAFNALSESERESLDVAVFSRLLSAAYTREGYLLKKEGLPSGKSDVHKKITEIIKMPAYVEAATELYNAAKNINSTDRIDAFYEQLKTASGNAIALAGCYNGTYFSKKASEKDGGKLIDLAAEKISAVTMKADAVNKPVQPKSVSKPNAKKYPGGESDPNYISDYKKYLAYTKENAEFFSKKYAYETEKHYINALKALSEVNSETSYAYNVATTALDAFQSFLSVGTTTAKEFNKIYSSLSDNQKTWLAAIDNYGYSITKFEETVHGSLYSYQNLKLSEIVEFIANIGSYSKIADFEATIESITAPYTNKDIEKLKKAQKAVPKIYQDLKLVDVTGAKYKAILASAGKDTPSTEQPDLSAYKQTDVSYKYIGEDDASMLADVLVDLVLTAAGVSDAKELVNTKILTGKTVVSIAGLIFPMLEELTDGMIYITPESLAGKLTEEKFAGAKAALEEAYNDWENVNITSPDFGFEDGDAEGFIDAATAVLRGASLVHVGLKFENDKNTSKGIYYGGYEDLIEIFETLDLDVEMDSEEYTTYVKDSDNANDAKIRAILVPIVSLITAFGNDPVGVINDVLPKLAYAIDSGIVDNNIYNLLDKFSLLGFTIPPVDLSTSGIYKILNNSLLEPNDIKLSESDFSTLIEKLAGCGKAVSKPSKQSDREYRLGIESDKSKSVVVLITFILDTAADNRELVSSLLGAANVNPLLKFALTLAISSFATFVPRRVIFPLISLFVYLARFFAIFM